MSISSMKNFTLAVCKPLIWSLRTLFESHMSDTDTKVTTHTTDITAIQQRLTTIEGSISSLNNQIVSGVSADLIQRLQNDVTTLATAVSQMQIQLNNIDSHFNE